MAKTGYVAALAAPPTAPAELRLIPNWREGGPAADGPSTVAPLARILQISRLLLDEHASGETLSRRERDIAARRAATIISGDAVGSFREIDNRGSARRARAIAAVVDRLAESPMQICAADIAGFRRLGLGRADLKALARIVAVVSFQASLSELLELVGDPE